MNTFTQRCCWWTASETVGTSSSVSVGVNNLYLPIYIIGYLFTNRSLGEVTSDLSIFRLIVMEINGSNGVNVSV